MIALYLTSTFIGGYRDGVFGVKTATVLAPGIVAGIVPYFTLRIGSVKHAINALIASGYRDLAGVTQLAE